MTRQYLFIERAHLMCPNMCFGIAMTVKRPFDTVRASDVMRKSAAAHSFLRALLGYEADSNRYYYDITDESKVESIFSAEEVSSLQDPVIQEKYAELTGRDWDLRNEGLLKAVFWKYGEETCVLFVFHHLLADGRAALGLATEFAKCYVFGAEPVPVQEQLIASVDDLPAGSNLPLISRMLVRRCNRTWSKENHRIGYEEYHTFADSFLITDWVKRKVQMVERSDFKEILSACKTANVSVNDYLLAKMFVDDGAKKIVIAQDIRSQLRCWKPGSLGNFSTAMSITFAPKGSDIMQEAKRVRDVVRKTVGNTRTAMTVLSCYAEMEPGLLDAAAISALGGWSSKAGQFVGGRMLGYQRRNGYSITNLGKIEESTIHEAAFFPPASPAMRKTLGVLTVNGNMAICSAERVKNF